MKSLIRITKYIILYELCKEIETLINWLELKVLKCSSHYIEVKELANKK